jgi:hypothetical protein
MALGYYRVTQGIAVFLFAAPVFVLLTTAPSMGAMVLAQWLGICRRV